MRTTARLVTRDGQRYRLVEAVSRDPGELDTLLRSAARRHRLVRGAGPYPVDGEVWGARLIELPDPPPPGQAVRAPRAELPPPAGPALSWLPPPWLTRQVVVRAAAVLLLGTAVAGLGWAAVRATAAAAAWTGDHAGQLVAALVLAGFAGVAWLVRKLGRRNAGTSGCTTTTVHTRRCRGH